MKKIITLGFCSLLLISCISAMAIDYYYHPDCGHCQKIAPFLQNVINNYKNVNWQILDTSQGSYRVSGTPTLVINTEDGREITLGGSQEIPQFLECELNEQSNLNCPTYSASQGYNCETQSWFIR